MDAQEHYDLEPEYIFEVFESQALEDMENELPGVDSHEEENQLEQA